MSAKPFFKLFFSDLAGDTLHLSDAEFGSYMLLLGAMWNAGGRLPDNPARLARIARCSPKVWGRRWTVLSPYFDAEDGAISSARMLRELQKVEHLSAERSAAGKKGAEAKALKNNDTPQANGVANHKQPEPEPDRTADDRREGVSDWPDGTPLDRAKLLVAEANTVYLDTAREPGLIQTLGRLNAWKRDGASWLHDILPVITTMAGKVRRPIKSWAYFDAAIGESIAANRRALTIPEHDDVQRADPRRPENPHDARRRAHLELLAEQGDDQREDQGGGADDR